VFLLGVVLAGTLAGEERLAWALADLVHAKPVQCQPVADQVRRGELSTLAAVNIFIRFKPYLLHSARRQFGAGAEQNQADAW
jgi:hypothetical protein